MIHLTPADYTQQPWKNGRGITTELWRHDSGGRLFARLSMATVAEDGPFSVFPGIRRNLTVLTGPGFRLTGPGIDLACAPLVPVAFPGEVAVVASGTGAGPSTDFNVLTPDDRPPPPVQVARDLTLAAGGLLALLALEPARVEDRPLAPLDLILTDRAARITLGAVLAVRLPPLPA